MKAMIIAFSMYSGIPMPVFVWEDEDRKKAMCYFPLIGAVIGALFYFLFRALAFTGQGNVFRAALLTMVPVLVTGGIHMDGFLDTCDARASFGDREKKLKILKDTHAGAFAVTGGALYFLLFFAACTELTEQSAQAAGCGFILSRSLSGFAVSVFPEARKQGMLADFMKDAHKKMIAGVMTGWIVLSSALMLWTGGWYGAAGILASAVTFFYYRHVALKEFGGVTGDLAGWFLQLCELGIVLSLAVMRYLI